MIPLQETMKLGFGLMRLPKQADGSIDIPQVCEMADRFLAAGGTYFDTAYVYDNGQSEAAFRAAVVDRYPREAYTICTKLNPWLHNSTPAKARAQFDESLARLGTGYFDYYLLHALMRKNIDVFDSMDLWGYVRERKEQGLIRHFGFSFHADPALLESLLQAHPEVDFVQLQINYADWENPGIRARECYEIARRHGKPIVVMEPLKGGALADPVPAVREVLEKAEPTVPIVSWGLRYAASLEGVLTVLSGMSSLAQMEQNLSFMQPFQPLNAHEQAVIRAAQDALDADKSIPCTACHYCTDGCPANIPIPELISVANRQHKNEDFRRLREYNIATTGRGKASDCLQCGQCESACPQHLEIISYLQKIAADFEI